MYLSGASFRLGAADTAQSRDFGIRGCRLVRGCRGTHSRRARRGLCGHSRQLRLTTASVYQAERLEAELAVIAKEIQSATQEGYLKGLQKANNAAELRTSLSSPIFKPSKESTRAAFQDKKSGAVLEQKWQPRKDLKTIAPEGSGREILLQAFNWESHKTNWWRVIHEKAGLFAELGITMAWLPPPTCSVAPQGYLPLDLYNLNSSYGSEQDLKGAVAALRQAGLTVLCDIVINHRCASKQDDKGRWNRFGGKLSWDASAIVGDDTGFGGRGGVSSGVSFEAAPNLDHSQHFVKSGLTEWLCWLRDAVGFNGWRFDFAKGYSGSHVGDYVASTGPQFVVGEFWDSLSYDGSVPRYDQDAHRQRMVDWLNAAGGGATAFDVTTKGILHAVFERLEYWRLVDADGRPPGLMGWWPSRSVTFLENHDTGSTQGHWRFPAGHLEEGYAYIMTHPGTPSIFLDHIEDEDLVGVIRRLIRLRKDTGIHCRSKVKILVAKDDHYAAKIDDKLLMKIGPGEFAPPAGEDWVPEEKGTQWQIWLRSAPQW